MGNRIRIWALCICCLGLVKSLPAHAVDMDEVDADVEESVADSDATRSQARLTQEQAVKEKAEMKNEARLAAQRRNAADAKKRDAAKELARAENEIAGYKAESVKHQKDRAWSDHQIAQADAKLKAMQARLAKSRGELEALRELREQQKKRLATLSQQIADTEMKSVRQKSETEDLKSQFKRGQVDEKAKQGRLNQALKHNSAQNTILTQQLDKLRAAYKAEKARTDVLEASNKQQYDAGVKTQEALRYGQAQMKQQQAARAAAQKKQAALAASNATAKQKLQLQQQQQKRQPASVPGN